jgi:hypothetical protein
MKVEDDNKLVNTDPKKKDQPWDDFFDNKTVFVLAFE